ncbi:MAG: type II toxin-antitoxin system Phd/YefM family antitoxin [Polyangiales bacterium]
MDTEVGLFAAKTQLSALIRRVEAGERFVISRHGRVVAVLGPPPRSVPRPQRGCARDADFWMDDDFDAPLEDFDGYMPAQ